MKREPSLLPVDAALTRILAIAPGPYGTEQVALSQARDRTLATDLFAQRTQPPVAVSAMDGYALRAADLIDATNGLTLVGESLAGRGFHRSLAAFEAVRIFTGAPVPLGADTILIQEYAQRVGDRLFAHIQPQKGAFIRKAGLDFAEGDLCLTAGCRLGAVELALAAAMNHAQAPVARRPRVAILATGDELVWPGDSPGPNHIVASNPFAIAALVEAAGGEAHNLAVARDNFMDLERAIHAAREASADVLVTLGGASVGEYDLVKPALAREGMELGFWRIAMRPGKPLLHGRLGPMIILGLPGNPVSSIICGLLFLQPLLRHLLGDPNAGRDRSEPAVLGVDLPANDARRDYLRARLEQDETGRPIVFPASQQDSSMLRVLAQSQCLLIRDAHALAAKAGERCRIWRL